jgi:hypothetical protein
MGESSALIAFFIESCPEASPFNKSLEKWTSYELVESYGFDKCKQAVLWYARVSSRQDWKHFSRIIDSCIAESNMSLRDAEARRKRRAIANEWRSS